MKNCFIPLLRRTTQRPIRLLTINFDPNSDERLISGHANDIEIIDVANSSKVSAENHNILFKTKCPEGEFVIITSDSHSCATAGSHC